MFNQTQMTVEKAKQRIASAAGKSDDPLLRSRAGDSLVAAIEHWQVAGDWDWLRTSTEYTINTNTNSIIVPYDFDKPYGLTLLGQNLSLEFIDRRYLNRVKTSLSAKRDVPLYYDIYFNGQLGEIDLYPRSGINDTIKFDYYRQMWVPILTSFTKSNIAQVIGLPSLFISGAATATDNWDDVTVGTKLALTGGSMSNPVVTVTRKVSRWELEVDDLATSTTTCTAIYSTDTTPLDFPNKYTNYLLAWATHHFLANRGGPPDRLSYWQSYAMSGLALATKDNTKHQDQDLSFQPRFNYVDDL